jgi:DNA mismatch endonuclease, patch repair protein
VTLTRSEQMSRIRGRDTKPEYVLRRELWRQGVRYRVNARTPSGRADVVFFRDRVAVFVDGCFWHGCPQHYVRPRSQSTFWGAKLAANFERDHRQTVALEAAGWRVLRFWEHEVFEDLPHIIGVVVAARRSRRTPSRRFLWRVSAALGLRRPKGYERWTLRHLRFPARSRVILRRRTTHKWRKSS